MARVDITKASGQWGRKKPILLSGKTGVGDQLKVFKTYKRKDITVGDAADKAGGWHKKFTDAIEWFKVENGVLDAKMKKTRLLPKKSRESATSWLNEVLTALENEERWLVDIFSDFKEVSTVFNKKLAVVQGISNDKEALKVAESAGNLVEKIKKIDRAAPLLVESSIRDALIKLNKDATKLKENYDKIEELTRFALQAITLTMTKL